jgi:cell division protein ZapA
MSEQQHKSMKVMIGGRYYPVIIEDENEAMIGEVVEEVNNNIKKFQATYHNKDQQDCITMLLLTQAVEARKNANQNESQQDLQKRIEALDQLVSAALA